jgi:hypothetical protein
MREKGDFGGNAGSSRIIIKYGREYAEGLIFHQVN